MLEKFVNKNSWLWQAPEYFNKWRIFPRAFIIFYFWLAFETAMWFMAIPVPTPSQSAFASAVIGAGAAWFGLYVNSSSTTLRHTPRSHNSREPDYRRDTEYRRPRGGNTVHVDIDLPESEVDDDIPVYQIKGE